jgi:NAD(P)-dependent dehydrogenase (short-subunit alcohol dehydrogenase family)
MTEDFGSFGLAGKVAIVTGPSQGIGRAIALGLAKAGANLVLVEHPSLHGEALKELACEIEELGRRAMTVLADVTDVSQIRSMADQATESFGRIDILVNNVGWTGTTAALEVTEEEWDHTLDACLKSTFFCSQAVARTMIAQGRGKIINLGSNFGITAFKGRAAYCAAKAGVHQLTRALALEWAGQGVNVNAVAPALTETAGRRHMFERPGFKEWAVSMLPAGRWNQPEDLVGAVLFLASPLSDMVVGHVLVVDGGWTIH